MKTVKLKETWNKYYNDPFGFADKVDLTFKNWNFNIFQKYRKLRRTAFVFSVICLGAWVFLGFDSTPLQFMHVLTDGLLNGVRDIPTLTTIYNNFYGKEMHYSAFVIYGLLFYSLNRHYDKNLNIQGSRNIAYSVCVTLGSIAVFEFFWMFSFAFFQNQMWVITPKFPQLKILLQNFAFLTVGAMGILYMFIDSHTFNSKGDVTGKLYFFRVNIKTFVLLGLTLTSVYLWINYPFHIERFNVETTNGIWSNSNKFPQTLYTIDVNTEDNVNAGVWFWKENNLIHGVNTLVKILVTLTFAYPFFLRKVKP